MKKILLPLTLLAFAAACGDSALTNPTATVGPEVPKPTFDDIANSVDGSIDAVAEVMPLNVGGPNGTTTLYVNPTNEEGGKNGCNLTGSTTLVVSISSSNNAVATVTPSTFTFTSCGTVATLTVAPHSQGSATISVAQTSNNTEGTFTFGPATFTVNVAAPPPANTAPTLAITGVTENGSYPKGSVPTATCEVTDSEDGNSSFAADLSAITGPYADDEIGEQTASCSYTDGGGLTASSSVTYTIIDPSAPTIGYTLDPVSPDGNNGWYKSNVTLTWNVSEPESPSSLEKTGCVNQNITADQAEATYSCSAKSVGGTASQVSVSIKRDATAPTVTASLSPAANAAGWNKADVTVSFSGSDALSGLDASSCTAAVTISAETSVSGQSVPGSCADNAGNSGSTTATVKIDKTVPTISGGWTPAANSNGWNNSPVTVSFNCGDLLSGIDTCTPSTLLNSEGTSQSVAGTAVDNAGNAKSATVSGINIDLTAPVVTVTGVTQGATYTLGSVPSAGCNTTDALSGVATSATVSLSGGQPVGGGTVGQITASCTGATDNAGNPGSKSVTYYVTFAWTGFFQPVDNGSVFNGVKAGSAIPVKFSLGGNQGLSIFMSGYPKVQQVVCNTTAPFDEIETTVTAGNSSLTYDAVAGQYVYVWKTEKAWVGTCRVLQVTLADGTPHTAFFQFK